jgi:hypothetical protein
MHHERRRNTQGYVSIRDPWGERPGFVLEHRLVMEAHLGRRLCDDEKVHHIDRRRDHNHITNLLVMQKAEHDSLHEAIDAQDKVRMNTWVEAKRSFMRSEIIARLPMFKVPTVLREFLTGAEWVAPKSIRR